MHKEKAQAKVVKKLAKMQDETARRHTEQYTAHQSGYASTKKRGRPKHISFSSASQSLKRPRTEVKGQVSKGARGSTTFKFGRGQRVGKKVGKRARDADETESEESSVDGDGTEPGRKRSRTSEPSAYSGSNDDG